MGLCKCQRKKVTNQFCYEHRVNVCEHCMVEDHPKCIVQSYLQWLQDSDYSPLCQLCNKELAAADCVRLICYHVFHWMCFDHYAKHLPSHTAPAGYTCPDCKQEIFPASNLVSPVADKLRNMLKSTTWAREGLGMSLVEDNVSNKANSASSDVASEDAFPNNHNHSHVNHSSSNQDGAYGDWSHTTSETARLIPAAPVNVSSPTSSIPDTSIYQTSLLPGPSAPRKLFDVMDMGEVSGNDHDENKYRRRSALEWLGRWYKNMQGRGLRRDPHRLIKRNVMIALLALLAIITLVVVFIQLGRSHAENDPFLDPMANPNIHVEDAGQ